MPKLKFNLNKGQIRNLISEKKKRYQAVILARLQRVGEQFIANARNRADFTDQTGNLRSSIGYVILYNGLQYHKGGFIRVKAGGEGERIGNKVLEEIAKNYPAGYVLIGVAGMDYAAAVESKGFDVITTSAGIAAKSLRDAFNKIQTKKI